ncbi:hypothetical protein FB45DRAFT_869661 [Roridomyces roridus]|uniref:Uncharacterized protein n=1 Tax=Roridomyces roridus TaxID=1738132 RepID=A0AAD7BMG1_9AGAR|nr:hypothetical protein FB45DRAFT_869661 [Roridomyces roridus]
MPTPYKECAIRMRLPTKYGKHAPYEGRTGRIIARKWWCTPYEECTGRIQPQAKYNEPISGPTVIRLVSAQACKQRKIEIWMIGIEPSSELLFKCVHNALREFPVHYTWLFDQESVVVTQIGFPRGLRYAEIQISRRYNKPRQYGSAFLEEIASAEVSEMMYTVAVTAGWCVKRLLSNVDSSHRVVLPLQFRIREESDPEGYFAD